VIGGRSAPPRDRFEEHLRAAWSARGGGRVGTPPTHSGAAPVARVELLAAVEARERFGADVTGAGVVAARLVLSNPTPRPYVIAVPLIGMLHPTGDLVRPLPVGGGAGAPRRVGASVTSASSCRCHLRAAEHLRARRARHARSPARVGGASSTLPTDRRGARATGQARCGR